MGGWFSSFFAEVAKVFGEHRTMRFLMVGLDNAGKTTILYAMKVCANGVSCFTFANRLSQLGEVVQSAPTIGFNVETITVSGITMSVWDIGGQTKLRQLWKHYYNGTIAVIFVVDSSDAERFAEARTELEQMGQDPELRDWTLLVLANKVDLPAAASVSEVTEALGLAMLKGPLAWHVQGCCALKKEGLQEGFTWLAETLKKQNKN